MDRIDILCRKDGELLREFSDRVLERLKTHFLFKVVSSLFGGFLDANVQKEVEKDRIAIRYAGESFRSGRKWGEAEIAEVLGRTKELDRAFVREISFSLLRVEIRYEDFEAIRKERITLIMGGVSAMLENWKEPVRFEEAVKKAFTEREYRDLIARILDLYSRESRKLAGSVSVIDAAGPAKDLFLGKVFSAMEEVGTVTAAECARNIFADSR